MVIDLNNYFQKSIKINVDINILLYFHNIYKKTSYYF